MEALYYGIIAVIVILLAILISVVVAMEWFKETEFIQKWEDVIFSVFRVLLITVVILFVFLLFYSGVILLVAVFTGII